MPMNTHPPGHAENMAVITLPQSIVLSIASSVVIEERTTGRGFASSGPPLALLPSKFMVVVGEIKVPANQTHIRSWCRGISHGKGPKGDEQQQQQKSLIDHPV